MPSSRPKEFRDDLIRYRFPALLWTPPACVDQRQSSLICYKDREFLKHLVTIHPVKGLPDCGDSKRPRSGRNVLSPGLQPLDVLSALECGQMPTLGDHVSIRVDSNDLGDSIGKRDCDGAWPAS